MVETIKFSEMTSGGDLAPGNDTPGLLSGGNVLFNNPWTFLAPGSTGDRPVPAAAMYYRLRFNTTLEVYEYYDPTIPLWTQLSGTGTGTVNPGVANDIAFYAASGTAVSPIASAANSVLVTNGSSVPSLSTTLPSGLSIPGATITSSTAALTAGSVVAAPVAGSDITNKTYVDALFASGVVSITGTTNQVIASSPTGNVTLSLPQDIATGSTPTFGGLTLTSIPLGATSGGTGQSTYTLGNILYSSATNTLAKLAGNITTTKQYLSQTGTGAVSAAPVWSTIDGSDITGAALTKVDDANVTATLGGTPSTALLRAASITLGWTGQLSLTRGGTAASLTASNGGIVYSNATTLAILNGTATARQMLQSGASTTPGWSTTTWPATSTINRILYSSSANVIGEINAAAGGVLISNSSSVPSMLTNPSATGRVLTSVSGDSPVWSTTTFPTSAGSAGTILRSNGTNFVNSTATFSDTYGASTLLYSNGANTVTGLATANSSGLLTNGSGVPAWVTVTGTGAPVLATSPTLVTPTLGVASATSINFGGSPLSTYTAKTAFTPTFSFATPGDLSVSYATQAGSYLFIGNMCFVSYVLVCTPTFTTASGAAQFLGLPATSATSCALGVSAKSSNITFPASCTQISAFVTSPNNFFSLVSFGTSTGTTTLTTANFTSGAAFTIGVSGFYIFT